MIIRDGRRQATQNDIQCFQQRPRVRRRAIELDEQLPFIVECPADGDDLLGAVPSIDSDAFRNFSPFGRHHFEVNRFFEQVLASR